MGDLYAAPPLHVCPTPIVGARALINIADRNPGSLWRCDECGKLYEAFDTIFGPMWREGGASAKVRARQIDESSDADHS